MAIDTAWLDVRITATQLSIEAYEAAFLAFANSAQSYTLDTGQNRQTVTRANLTEMRRNVTALYSTLSDLCARRDGGSVVVLPAW